MFDFPNTPTNGQQVTTPDGVVYIWDTVKWHTGSAPIAFVKKAGDSMTGPLILSGDPTVALQAATKSYADTKLALSGGTMTGPLTLAGDPAQPLQAATKAYVDGKFVQKIGDTMSGNLTLPNLLATGYVDVANGIGFSLFADSGPNRIIRFTSDNWRLVWYTNGTFAYDFAGANKWSCDASGNVWSAASFTSGYIHSTGGIDADGMIHAGDFQSYGNVNLVNNGHIWCGSIDCNHITTNGGDAQLWNTYCYGGLGINWANFSGYWMAFGWNGRIQCWVNGGTYRELRDTANDYVPNQNVDYNSSPSFWDMHSSKTWTNSGVWYAWGNHTFEFNWNGRVQCSVDNGGAIVTFHHDGQDCYVHNLYSDSLVKSGYGFQSGNYSGDCFGNWWNGGANMIMFRVNNSWDYYVANGSDEKIKQDIEPSTFDCLDAIKRIPLVQFRWKDLSTQYTCNKFEPGPATGPVRRIGFIAQRVHEIAEDLTVEGGEFDGVYRVWGIDTNAMLAALVGSVQELSAEIDEMKRTMH